MHFLSLIPEVKGFFLQIVWFALHQHVPHDFDLIARHILKAFCNVSSLSLSTFSLTFSAQTPQTILSLSISSSYAPNVQSLEIIFKSVTYWSMVSVLHCTLVWNLCLQTVIFSLGAQYSLNLWKSVSSLSTSLSSIVIVLNISLPSWPIMYTILYHYTYLFHIVIHVMSWYNFIVCSHFLHLSGKFPSVVDKSHSGGGRMCSISFPSDTMLCFYVWFDSLHENIQVVLHDFYSTLNSQVDKV